MKWKDLIELEVCSMVDMSVINDSTASNGQYVNMGETGELACIYTAENAGYYDIHIAYRAIESDRVQFLKVNGVDTPIGFGYTTTWQEVIQPFYLRKGINMLGMSPSWGFQDVDYFAIGPAEVEFKFTPNHITFYKEFPVDQVLKVDNYRRDILEVRVGDQVTGFAVEDYPHQESAVLLRLNSEDLQKLEAGDYKLEVFKYIEGKITISDRPAPSELMVVAPDVSHGSALLLSWSTGKKMLIDSGQEWVRDDILIPLLERHGIDTIHTFILTHYHDDHDSGDRGQLIRSNFNVQKFIDYQTHPTGYEWVENGTSFKILNSYEDGEDENSRSLAFRILYNDFVFIHDGDIYGHNQQRILDEMPEKLPAQLYYANHHFHGSVNPDYIIKVNPDLVLLQAQEAIYARYAYMVNYKKDAEAVLNQRRTKKVESLPTMEAGLVVVRINTAADWLYETYKDQDTAIIPGL